MGCGEAQERCDFAMPTRAEVHQDRASFELETNECYQQNLKLDTNAACGQTLPAMKSHD